MVQIGPSFVRSFSSSLIINHFRYHDPDGESVLGFVCGVGQMIAGGALIVTGTAIELATFGGYTIGFAFQTELGATLIASGFTQAMYNAKDVSFEMRNFSIPQTYNPVGAPFELARLAKGALEGIKTSGDVYAPDRPLPRDKRTKEPVGDTDASHTQLGTKEGRKGKYPQAREFDKKGKPVRDIDFTDHGSPSKHPNPHQHSYEPNQTGGTFSRGKKAEFVPEWRY